MHAPDAGPYTLHAEARTTLPPGGLRLIPD